MAETNNIIAVGGGKGGIGKSVLSTNLAVGLALSGQKVILVDTDFGSSNLHALLGISDPKFGFHELFLKEGGDVSSLLLDTGISNLKFLSGAGDLVGSANISRKHIEKILKSIKALKADNIILDLGPGTAFNVIDYFNISDQGVVLTLPEMPSFMNTFSFLKAALFQRISKELSEREELQPYLDLSYASEMPDEVYSIHHLKQKFEEIAPECIPIVDQAIQTFKPGLVVNRVRKKKHLELGDNLVKLSKKYLDIDLLYHGYIVESDRVRDSIDNMVPFLIEDPQSNPSENLQKIIGSITHSDLHFQKKDGMIFVSKQVQLSQDWGH